jgi:hypothetical protein
VDTYVDAKCRAELTPRGAVFAYVGSGHITVPMVKWLCDRFDDFAENRQPPLVAFANFQGVVSYDTAARVEATAWFKANVARVDCYHVAVASKLLSMGLSTMALLSGVRLKMYSDVTAFERALADAAAEPASVRRPS